VPFVSCSVFHVDNYFMVNTREKFEVLKLVKVTMLFLGGDAAVWTLRQIPTFPRTFCLHPQG
jgi:hypothetical protein